ncbi:MAG TPA: DUF2723 domain-containing protein [Vicinamibacterales bacterium]|nr:DUF2723 domain-containing protein [Vicinamibacterales bacterium]
MAGRELPDRNQGSTAVDPAGTGFVEGLNFKLLLLAATGVALAAFACYHATLLPGLDYGDTAAFQTGVGSINLTPRQAYPLYYGLGNLFARIDPGEPAHAMNLASAVYGALAAGMAVWAGAELAGSIAAGVTAGLLLAFSYTFWTQAIIAEVYTLHLLIVGCCLAALLAWVRKPTLARLAVFYAIFAVGFGNHLSMVLLLPAFTVFILLCRRPGPDDPVRPKAIALALLIAAAGALQYAWNFRGLWLADPAPSSLWDALGKFWFDVTKSDWRETLVATVSEAGLRSRPAMYWFELRQQFGVPGVLMAVAGFAFIAARWWRAAVLLFLAYLVNLIFAWNYNVGDVHVFFLPSHYFVALCAGAGIAALARLISVAPMPPALSPLRRRLPPGVAVLAIAYAAWRGYDTFPAVDRSWDSRPTQVLDRFTAPLKPGCCSGLQPGAIFGVDMNWQIQNAVEYYMRRHKPDVPWFTASDLSWLAVADHDVTQRVQRFVEANLRLRREVIVTPDFVKQLVARGYDGPIQPVREGSVLTPGEGGLAEELAPLRGGTPYALGILRPYKEYPIDESGLAAAWTTLTGRADPALPVLGAYGIVVGRVGQPPVLVETRDRPFRTHARIDVADFDIRMESWLPADTIRRAGFGHVIVNRTHVLALDRGVSVVALGPAGEPALVAYRSGTFANIPRLLLRSQGGG